MIEATLLVEEVEGDAEVAQVALLLVAEDAHREVTEAGDELGWARRLASLGRPPRPPRLSPLAPLAREPGDLPHVLPVVAALGDLRGLACQLEEPRVHRLAELIDLAPHVVDVELAVHAVAGPLEERGDRVAERGAPAVPDVERAGRVGRDELHHDGEPAPQVAAAIRAACAHELAQLPVQEGVAEPEVDESVPGDLRRIDAEGRKVDALEQPLGDLPRRLSQARREGERDVGGKVAERGIRRPLEGGIDAVRRPELTGRSGQRLAEGGHPHPTSSLPSPPSSSSPRRRRRHPSPPPRHLPSPSAPPFGSRATGSR